VVKLPLLCQSGDYELTVSGTWRYSPGTLAGPATPDTAIITVLPYSRPVFFIPERVKIVPLGEECSFVFNIINKGNCDDNVTITYACPDHVQVNGPASILLHFDDNESFKIKMKQNGGIPKSNEISISIMGSHEGMTPSSSTSITLKTTVSVSSIAYSWFFWVLIVVAVLISGSVAFFMIKKRRKARMLKALR
jgi:hypothetical protein